MSSTNLTREEARHRARVIGGVRYRIGLDLASEPEAEIFDSVTEVEFTVKETGDVFLDLRAAEVREAVVDGADAPAEMVPRTADGAYDEEAGLRLPGLKPGRHVVRVRADCRYSNSGQGLHRFHDPADDETYLYTQFETADAKRMFACFDQPDIKATYAVDIRTPAGWRVIGNAEQEVREEADGTLRHVSEIDYPLSTYLVAICVGPYAEVRSSWKGKLTRHPETPADQPEGEITVPLGLYCRRSIAEHLDAERILRETRQGFDYYHRHFGFAYPFGKYDQVFVPEFNMGAMENAGCVTHRDEYVFTSAATHYRYERRADTILHEMAHMWFGDLVTMRWWDDLWLNESFATWSAAMSQAEATEYRTAWVTFANVEKAWAYQQDELPTTHPVFSGAGDIEEVEQNFDGITYAKGASVLKQLQAYVGREAFFAGVRRHFTRHAWGNATFDDLLDALQEASGRDLSGWAGEWLKTTGIPELRPDFTVDEQGRYSSFAVLQPRNVRTHRLAVGLYSRADDGTVRRVHRVETDVAGDRTEVPELVEMPAADLVLVNDDDLTYCQMGLDAASQGFLLRHMADIEDPMARTLCWSAAWELTRAGGMRARDFTALVAGAAHAETELAVLESVLGKAATCLRSYADPNWAADEGLDLLTGALLEGARQEDPERALIFARTMARLPLIPASAAWCRGVLQGDAGALDADADLRWLALTALIAAGEIPAAQVEAAVARELERDDSARGRQSAMRARAAMPDAAVKRGVFEELRDPASRLSNLAVRWKMEGWTFGCAEPALHGMREAYLENARGIWEEHESETAQALLNGLYPRWDISREHLEQVDALLSEEIPAGLRRVLAENRDRTARALRLRTVDRG